MVNKQKNHEKSITLKIRIKDLKEMHKKLPLEEEEYQWHYFMRVAKALPVL